MYPTESFVNDTLSESPKEQNNDKKKDLDINYVHRQLRHLREQALQVTMISHGFNSIGKLEFCEPCKLAKARSKPVPKKTHNIANEPAERMFIDLSGPFSATTKGPRYHIGIVDDFSRALWSYSISSKKLVGDAFKNHLQEMKSLGKCIKFLRCNNAGENTAYLELMAQEKGISMEYTNPHTPQQNGVVERKFPTLHRKANAMLHAVQDLSE